MNFGPLIALVWLVSALANWIHWGGNGDERFLYHRPQSRWLRLTFATWFVGSVAGAIGFLLGSVPNSVFLGAAVGFAIAQMLYSIARRHQLRKMHR